MNQVYVESLSRTVNQAIIFKVFSSSRPRVMEFENEACFASCLKALKMSVSRGLMLECTIPSKF